MDSYAVVYLVLILAGLGTIMPAAMLISEQRKNRDGTKGLRIAVESTIIVFTTFIGMTLTATAFAAVVWAMSTYVCDGPCMLD